MSFPAFPNMMGAAGQGIASPMAMFGAVPPHMQQQIFSQMMQTLQSGQMMNPAALQSMYQRMNEMQASMAANNQPVVIS